MTKEDVPAGELPPFIKYEEDMAVNVTGEGPDGNRLVLGEDCIVYLKLFAAEQGCLDRIRSFNDQHLGLDIDAAKGYIYFGDFEEVRLELHRQIDAMFAAMQDYRESQRDKENLKSEESTEA